MTSTTAPAELVTKGNGTAIHIARRYDNGRSATLCDHGRGRGGPMADLHPAIGAATCKSCLKAKA